MRDRRLGLLVAAALAATSPPAAAAEGRVGAQPRNAYSPAEVTIARGDSLVFANNDIAPHDVTADGAKPAFHSAVMSTAQQGQVDGVPDLGPGRYGFHCSLHTFMKGTLAVTGLTAAVATASRAQARKGIVVTVALWPGAEVTVSGRLGSRRLGPVTRTVAGTERVRLSVPAGAGKARRVLVTASSGGQTARASRTLR
jgi:plastocyanin